MAKDKVETQLEELRRVRNSGSGPEAEKALKKALADRTNVVVAKAAEICGEFGLSSLLPQLAAAFERLFEEKDPQCWGKNALAKSLKDLGWSDSKLFLRGLKHVQLEGVWGGNADTAMQLRGACALALVQCVDLPRFEKFRLLVDSLTDKEPGVRSDAALAIEQLEGHEAILLLRLKARLGDKDPRIVGQVLELLLRLEGREALPFAGAFLENPDDELREESALALGASRLPEALALLLAAWKRNPRTPGLLRAVSISRLDEAIQFLLELLQDGPPWQASDALYALDVHRNSEEIALRVEKVVRARNHTELTRIFGERFTAG